MSEDNQRYPGADGGEYEVDLAIYDQGEAIRYGVEAVRWSLDEHGLPRSQRLCLAEHGSQMEAEEHQQGTEQMLAGMGVDALGSDLERLQQRPFEPVAYLVMVSPADDVGEAGVSVMAFQQDHFATVPLAAGEMAEMERLAMQLEETQVEQGDLALLNAAWLVGQDRGMIPSGRGLFAEVEQPETEYYFGYGVGPENLPALEVVKTWEADGERRFDTLTVGEYGSFDEAAVDERELETLLKDQGLEAAMHQAERMAEAGGYLDPKRADPRIFFEDDAPPDPFQTVREREMTSAVQLLEPLDDAVNYAVVLDDKSLRVEKHWEQVDGLLGVDQLVVMAVDPESKPEAENHRDNLLGTYDDIGLQGMMHQAELTAMLHGTLDAGRMDTRLFTDGPPDRFETLAQQLEGEVNPYFNTSGEQIEEVDPSLPQYGIGAIAANGEAFVDVVKSWGEYQYERLVIPQPSWEEAQFQAESAFTLQQNGELEKAMQQIESLAEEAGVLDPERDDPRLFKTGPPDPFVTKREMAIDAELDRYGVTWREVHEWENEPPEVENPYWRWDILPVNDPAGEPLGHALHMIVYDGVEHDPETVGSPVILEDEPFRMLEVAHFETQAAADQFGKALTGYLMPGVLDANELAEEVAQSNGHEAEWRTLNGQELNDYRNLNLTLIRDPADWHPYGQDHAVDVEFETEEFYDPARETVDSGYIAPDMEL